MNNSDKKDISQVETQFNIVDTVLQELNEVIISLEDRLQFILRPNIVTKASGEIAKSAYPDSVSLAPFAEKLMKMSEAIENTTHHLSSIIERIEA
jgi:hypothetical protein